MATVIPSDPKRPLRGKLGGMIYALQADGTITVRSLGEQRAPSTPGEKKGQQRMRLAHPYVRWALSDSDVARQYTLEATKRGMHPRSLAFSDFLTDPVIAGVDASNYHGQTGQWLLIMTGDDFKVTRVGVVLRNAAAERIEEGFAEPALGSTAKAWVYSAQWDFPVGQILTFEVTATDRCGHSCIKTVSKPI